MCVLKRAKVICFPSFLQHFTILLSILTSIRLKVQKISKRGQEKVRIQHKSSKFCHYCGLGPLVWNVKFCICPTAQFNTQTPSQTLPLSHNAAACAQASNQLGDLFSLKMKEWLRLGRPALALRFPLLQHDCGNRIANSIGLKCQMSLSSVLYGVLCLKSPSK